MRRLSGKRQPMRQPGKTLDGENIKSQEQLAEEWAKYAEGKVSCTEREKQREELSMLPERKERVG